jgi:hypothetical protein
VRELTNSPPTPQQVSAILAEIFTLYLINLQLQAETLTEINQTTFSQAVVLQDQLNYLRFDRSTGYLTD